MIKAKTMTHWENENYDYPLPDVSHFSKKEAKKLKIRMSINTYPAAIFVRKNFIAAVFCFMQFTSFQPTDLVVAGCGVCMMLPGTILPPGMGVPFFIGVILRLYSVSSGTFPTRRFTVSSM